MNSSFNSSYMALSSSTYLPFFQQIYTDIMRKKSHQNLLLKFELKLSFVGQLLKLIVTLPFLINFTSQIEHNMSYYRLLGASRSHY